MGDVNGDGLPELAIGRLSGDTASQVTQVLNKIKAYEAQAVPSQARGLLLADAPDAAGDFNANIAILDGVLSNKFLDVILRRTDLPDAAT